MTIVPEFGTDRDYRVAVVIPVYNGAEFLAETIESVLAQTMQPAEIIVVDDGSSDDSLSIARSFSGVRVIAQANAGVSVSRNRAVAEASAPWIAFLDADDVWDPRKLEVQMAAIRNSPKTDLCFTATRELTKKSNDESWEIGPASRPPASGAVGRLLYGKLRIVPSCVILRRSKFLSVGGFAKEASPCEDWDLWLRLEQAGATFTALHEPLLLYRQHSNNTSNNSRRMYDAERRAFEKNIAPRYGKLNRWWRRLQAISRFEAGVALVDREQRRPHLFTMLASLLIFPFGDWRRYKIALHMLLHGR